MRVPPPLAPVCLGVILACSRSVSAQAPAVLADPYADYAEAAMLFERDAHGLASMRYGELLADEPLASRIGVGTGDDVLRAELNRALAAERADLPEARALIGSFVDRYSPRPIALTALKTLADRAFAARDYPEAAAYYDRLPLDALAPDTRDEVRFRLGYTAFVEKDFPLAGRYLGDLRVGDGPHREPATYYFALTRFYSGDNAGARAAFEALTDSEAYAAVVPGNLAQIYFADGEYDRVAAYAVPAAETVGAGERDKLYLLIGRSYFELGRYAEALPYLEHYAAANPRMSGADFYQLGYAQYQVGAYEAAAANLKQLAAGEDALTQVALYYLGNAYLQLGDRVAARPAFAAATRLEFDPQIREEAAYNVAKLSYELGYDQDALTGLQAIPAGSRYFEEAQGLLGRLLLQSRDYGRALEVLAAIESPTPALRETEQRVLVLRGLQLLGAGEETEARLLLRRSLADASDAYHEALALYWLGDLAYRRGDYATADERLRAFLASAERLDAPLPDDANPGTAHYTLGYAALKRSDYPVALGHFQEAVAALRRRGRRGGGLSARLTRVLGDAVVRAGDANFKRNDYPAAERFYDEAIENRYAGYVYALYQKALVSGLTGEPTEKLIALETIADEHPRSEFADDALLELGDTYLRINQLKRAAQALARIVDDLPDSPLRNEALLQLGLVSLNRGDPATAIGYYEQVFANQPRASEVRRADAALQEIYVDELGRPDDYFAFLETVPGFKLDASVRDSITYSGALARYRTGDLEAAVEQFTRYLAEFPRGGYADEALFRRGDTYVALERYEAAQADFEALAQRGEGRYYAQALDRAARIASDEEEDYAKANRYYTRLLEVTGELPPELQLPALRAAYVSGDAATVATLTDVVAADSSLTDGERATAEFYRGKIAYDARDYDAALTRFNAVIRAAPDTEAAAESRYLVARIYYLQRELELAENITVAAQRQSSAYPYWVARSTLLLIDLFADRGDFLAARAVAEGLVANYRGDEELEAEAAAKLVEIRRAAEADSRVTAVDTSVVELAEPEND